jgi:hypothetical protein
MKITTAATTLAQMPHPDRQVLLELWQQEIAGSPRVPDPRGVWQRIGQRLVDGDPAHRHLGGVCASLAVNPTAAHGRTDATRIVADVGTDHDRHIWTLQALIVDGGFALTADAYPLSHGDAGRTRVITRSDETTEQLLRDQQALAGLGRAIAAGYAHPRTPSGTAVGLSSATPGSIVAGTAIVDGHRPGVRLELAGSAVLQATDAPGALARLLDQIDGLLLQPLLARIV